MLIVTSHQFKSETMKHLKWKSLAFYGLTIGSVLVLFKAVTAYGESNLKAPQQIGDRYRLVFSDNLPNCEKLDDLMLNIQQSGIYLNGSLFSAKTKAETSTGTHEKPSLTGILSHQQLSLSGKVPKSILCNIASANKGGYTHPQDNLLNLVTIQIQMLDKDSLAGQLTVGSIPKTLKFTTLPQTAQESSEKLKSH